MKLSQQNINSFIKNIPPKIKCILLYGVDYGLVTKLTNNITSSFLDNNIKPDNIFKFDASTIIKDFFMLENAILSNNLFGENLKKVIILQNCTSTITKIISKVINQIDENILLILNAEQLSKSNSLRKLAETSSNIATIACYHDSIDSIKTYILNILKNNNFKISQEALNWLATNLGNDRLITNQEINKLILYKNNNNTIDFLDVINIISNNSELSLNKVVNNILLGNQLELYSLLKHFLLNYPAIAVIRALNNSLKRLLTAKILLQDKNLNIQDIANTLNPPVIYIFLKDFKTQLNLWDIININVFLKKLIFLEIFIKNNPNLSEVALNKLTLDIYMSIRKRG